MEFPDIKQWLLPESKIIDSEYNNEMIFEDDNHYNEVKPNIDINNRKNDAINMDTNENDNNNMKHNQNTPIYNNDPLDDADLNFLNGKLYILKAIVNRQYRISKMKYVLSALNLKSGKEKILYRLPFEFTETRLLKETRDFSPYDISVPSSNVDVNYVNQYQDMDEKTNNNSRNPDTDKLETVKKLTNRKIQNSETITMDNEVTIDSQNVDYYISCTLVNGTFKYTCCCCEKIYAKRNSLVGHINAEHFGLKPYACSWSKCGKLFGTLKGYSRHIDTVHKDIYKFICNFEFEGKHYGCTKTFSRNDHLLAHIRRERNLIRGCYPREVMPELYRKYLVKDL